MTSIRDEFPWMTDETRLFRRSVRHFIETELAPHHAEWEQQGYPDADAWLRAGKMGLLLADVPEQCGGGGGTFAHEAVVIEELARSGVNFGFNLQSIVAHYILSYGSEEQRQRWLPRLASGKLVGAVGLTEPQSGSDLQGLRTIARRDGDSYIVNGSKTFITNGIIGDFVLLAVKTDPAKRADGVSLLLVDANLPGFRRGRTLKKVGNKAQDTAELFFEDMRVPVDCLLGAENEGWRILMHGLARERMVVAVRSQTIAEVAVDQTVEYTESRTSFGGTLFDFQNTQFTLAEAATGVEVTRPFVDRCIALCAEGKLSPVTAAMAKLWTTELQDRILDDCVQLHGGYGYMWEYPITRAWADARAHRIYAGSNEVMKYIIGRSLKSR